MTKPALRAVPSAPSGPFTLPPLPYPESALEPVISARTLSFHQGKHHKAYIDKLNAAVAGTPYAEMDLLAVVKKTCGREAKKSIFNNAAQAWNHTFYWHSLSPAKTEMDKKLSAAVTGDFGSLEALQQLLTKVATEHFGSGWAWLVVKDGKLQVVDTHDADTPAAHGATCLLTVDVWEHAYYLDRQNDRNAYAEAVVKKLLNWSFASDNFARAQASA